MFGIWGLRQWPTPSLDEARKRGRILVIDDSDFFYVDLFRRDGYTIEQWRDVDDLGKLESGYYDILLLDIHGVGKALSADEGHGVLKHLRDVSPAQIIVAFSNADWPLRYREFFDLADATLDKRQDYVEFKREIDRLLLERFSLDFYLRRVSGLVQNPDVDHKRLAKLAKRAVLSGEFSTLEKYLRTSGESGDRIAAALNVIASAASIIQAFA